jgi:hypothetical protein
LLLSRRLRAVEKLGRCRVRSRSALPPAPDLRWIAGRNGVPTCEAPQSAVGGGWDVEDSCCSSANILVVYRSQKVMVVKQRILWAKRASYLARSECVGSSYESTFRLALVCLLRVIFLFVFWISDKERGTRG